VQEQRATAVEEPAKKPAKRRKPKKDQRPKRQPRYHVILWNDDDHTVDYVIVMMHSLFGHPLERGFTIAREVHNTGRAIVLTTTLEHAELKRDQIHSFGKDRAIRACKGSMSATLEAEIG
jgi:ATP-dependent Clp protease adaptor protein ClpS